MFMTLEKTAETASIQMDRCVVAAVSTLDQPLQVKAHTYTIRAELETSWHTSDGTPHNYTSKHILPYCIATQKVSYKHIVCDKSSRASSEQRSSCTSTTCRTISPSMTQCSQMHPTRERDVVVSCVVWRSIAALGQFSDQGEDQSQSGCCETHLCRSRCEPPARLNVCTSQELV